MIHNKELRGFNRPKRQNPIHGGPIFQPAGFKADLRYISLMLRFSVLAKKLVVSFLVLGGNNVFLGCLSCNNIWGWMICSNWHPGQRLNQGFPRRTLHCSEINDAIHFISHLISWNRQAPKVATVKSWQSVSMHENQNLVMSVGSRP